MKLILLLAFALSATSAEIVVTVTGVSSSKGKLGCALFPSAGGFPMNRSQAQLIEHPSKPGPMECRFDTLKPGRYAVAVSVDLNENGKTDTNFVGMPTEPWGVSNNARPRMRAPKFDEAAFELKEGETKRIEIQVPK